VVEYFSRISPTAARADSYWLNPYGLIKWRELAYIGLPLLAVKSIAAIMFRIQPPLR
jgi:hypothetical protein